MLFAVGGIALVPGFMNAFLAASRLIDQRPARRVPAHYPGISILVAAYNEAASIADTLESIAKSSYPGDLEVIVIDDGSSDTTADIAARQPYSWLRVLQHRNQGQSAALNRGLAESRFDLIVTLDADSRLYRDALPRLVERYMSDPAQTRAVAGTMLVRNSRQNWVTRAQEWDYFHGIAAIKRVQSLYQGTLVAQGAFSIYSRATVRELSGWQDCVGEDIVLTWAFLQAGWRVGHAEDACCFTNAPESLKQFIRQRQRWARGMMEAFRHHPRILVAPRMTTLFVWWNVLFPWLDLAYALFFLPGIPLAFFGIYWIAGPLTLVLLPMALVMNYLMSRIGDRMFAQQGLRVRRNVSGFLIYAFAYSAIPATCLCIGIFLRGARPAQDLGHQVIPLRFAPALLLACLCGTAHAQNFGGLTNVVGEIDANHFSAIRLRAGGLSACESPWKYFGIAAQENLYSQSGWHQTATAVLGLWRDQARDILAGINAEAGVVEVARRTRPIGDLNWSLRPAPNTGVEWLAAAGLVETQTAIEQGIGYTFWGASVEQTIAERFTVIALAGYQPFSDGNDRVHFRARLVWDALP